MAHASFTVPLFLPARVHRWPRCGLLACLIGTGTLAPSAPLPAQDGKGVHLKYGAFLARPYLDERSGAVFEQVGRLRAGLGITFGIGYGLRRFGATAVAEFAGLEVGPETERDGINMGRQSAILRSYGLLAHWSPARRLGAWQPVLSAGYLRQGIDNVMVRADQLPAYARDPGVGPDARPAGVAGSGFRLGFALDHVLAGSGLPGRLALRLEGAGDGIAFTRMTYDGNEQPLPNSGRGFTPRVGAILRWSPTSSRAAEVE